MERDRDLSRYRERMSRIAGIRGESEISLPIISLPEAD